MESEFPKKGQSGSASNHAFYSVEARCGHQGEPRVICGVLYGDKWKRVEFSHTDGTGIPTGPRWHVWLRDELNLLSYASAQALRWWLHAQAELEMSEYSLETRIVEHRVGWTYKAEMVAAYDVIGAEDRSSLNPGWGKAKPQETPPDAPSVPEQVA